MSILQVLGTHKLMLVTYEERGVHQVHLEGRHYSQEAAGSYHTHERVSVAERFKMWSVVRLAKSFITGTLEVHYCAFQFRSNAYWRSSQVAGGA